MFKTRNPSKAVLEKIPIHYFETTVPKDFDPASISWVTPEIGITAWDGVDNAIKKGYFIINVADEISNEADAKISVDPGSGTVLTALDHIQSLIHKVISYQNQKVVVHCAMGMERSVLSVVWYLHQTKGLSLDQAYDLVRIARPIALDHRDWIFE